MQGRTDYLFTLELRIRKENIKLNVYESDSLNDLFNRVAAKASLKQKHNDSVRDKLEAEMRRMANNPTCSHQVRSKLQSLTEESKLIILSVTENEKVEQSLNETPFKILLETSGHFRKHSVELGKRSYLNENHESPALKRNYNKPYSQIIHERGEDENYESKPQKYQITPANEYSALSYIGSTPEPNAFKRYGGGESLRDYSPIANINSNRPLKPNKLSSYEAKMQLDMITEQVRDRNDSSSWRYHRFDQNYQFEEPKTTESFQTYKMHKNKSQGSLNRQPSAQNLKRKYISNQQDIITQNSYKKLNDFSQKAPPCYLARCYDGEVTKANKKFSYLEEFNV